MSKDRLRNSSAHARQVCDWAKENGWTASRTKSDHIRLDKEGCQTIFTSLTPSCPFTFKRLLIKAKQAEAARVAK